MPIKTIEFWETEFGRTSLSDFETVYMLVQIHTGEKNLQVCSPCHILYQLILFWNILQP